MIIRLKPYTRVQNQMHKQLRTETKLVFQWQGRAIDVWGIEKFEIRTTASL